MIAKGGVALENLAKAKVAVFDKTGTLTTGTFAVTQVRTAGMERAQLLRLVAGAESASSHPIARAIVAAAGARETRVENLKEIPGRGISAVVEGHQVFVGNRLLMEESGFTPEEVQAGGHGRLCCGGWPLCRLHPPGGYGEARSAGSSGGAGYPGNPGDCDADRRPGTCRCLRCQALGPHPLVCRTFAPG